VFAVTSGCLLAAAVCGCGPPAQTPSPYRHSAPPTFSGPRRPLRGDPESEARQILLEGLADRDPRIRSNAIEAIATTRAIRLLPRIQRMLQDPAVPVRFLAALSIGDLEYSLAKDEVEKLLTDPDPNVRIAAAYALLKLGQPEHFPTIRDAVASKDQTIRANAALLLGKSGRQDALRFLYWVLQQPDSGDMVTLQTAESIARLGDRQIYPKLWTRLISAYADDRMIGVRAMAALGTEEAKNALITVLDDSVLEVRLAAAEQLGKLGDKTGEPEVQEVFEKNLLAQMDPLGAQRVKVLTALAIGEIGSAPLARHLPELLQDPSQAVRLAAAKAVLRLSR
jgi:HEAT repeat protein